jgi:dynein heavy chain 1
MPQQRTGESDPLVRFFIREALTGSELLRRVRKDLSLVLKVCRGDLKQTNHLRGLIGNLTKG